MTGIFIGKGAENNKLVLKSLVTGPKIAKEIASFIYLNKGTIPSKKRNENKIRSIEAEITRKRQNGTLPRLENKGYIRKTQNGQWDLTDKGTAVALTLFDSPSELLERTQRLNIIKQSKKVFDIPILKGLSTGFQKVSGIDILGSMNRSMENGTYLQLLAKFTEELIKQGVDLDRLSDEEFSNILSGRLSSYFVDLALSRTKRS